MGEAVTRRDPQVRETGVEDKGPQPLPLVDGDPLTLPPKVSSRMKRELHRPPFPFAGRANNGANAKRRKLSWHSRCLQAAGVEVKFPEEG